MSNSELVFEEHIPGKNGIPLRLRRTVMSDAKAAVVIVYGVGEHLDRLFGDNYPVRSATTILTG